MTVRIQLRRDLQSNWIAINPVLAIGEPGVEYDTGRIKIGDGVTVWSNLKYASGPGDWAGLDNKPIIPRDINQLTDVDGILNGLSDQLDGGGATTIFGQFDREADGATASVVYDAGKTAYNGNGA